jgi:hypothetical protein
VSECARFDAMIERLVASDLSPQDRAALFAHAKECEGCRRLLEIHGELVAAGAQAPEPDEAELDFVQERIQREVRRRRDRKPLRAAAIAAGLIFPFAAGLILGRALPARPDGQIPSSRLIDALHAEAAANRGLTDVEDSPFNYSNVSFRRVPGDRVALDFDVTTHLASVEPRRSPLVRDVLAQSLLNPSSVGERLKAMSFAAGELEPKLEQAVLFSLRRDESVAVRLAALTVLVSRLDDDDVRGAVMAAMRDDPSVQVRLAALESLASHRVDHGRIREAIRERERPGDQALMVRLTELERKP